MAGDQFAIIEFKVRNRKLYDFFRSIGVEFLNTSEGLFSEEMIVVLPSGKQKIISEDFHSDICHVTKYSSISAWLVSLMSDEIGISAECYSEFLKEFTYILNGTGAIDLDGKQMKNREDWIKQLTFFDMFDNDLTQADIEIYESRYDEIVSCEKVKLENGKRKIQAFSVFEYDDSDEEITVNDLWNCMFAGGDVFKLASKKGIVFEKTEVWQDGTWLKKKLT